LVALAGLIAAGCGGGASENNESAASGGDAPAIRIPSPADGDGVAGLVGVELEVSGAVGEVELSAGGQTICVLSGPPYRCDWDVTRLHDNPLPAASHSFDFGYYYVDGKYGDYRSEVNGHTNIYYALAWAGYVSELPWGDAFSESLANAAMEDRRIHLNVAGPDYLAEALDRSAPYWARVVRIELADEPPWSQAETEAIIAGFRAELAARSLPAPPIGIVYTRQQVLAEDAIFAAGLDWVGIEAYVDPPGDPSSAVNVQALEDYVNQAKARVPAEKNLVLVMQAYDRNGAWTNMETLVPLQTAAYDLARDDPRVLSLNMFAYGRPGGSHDHPELRHEHLKIGEKLLGITVAELSNGPATLTAKSTSGASDSVEVSVEN